MSLHDYPADVIEIYRGLMHCLHIHTEQLDACMLQKLAHMCPVCPIYTPTIVPAPSCIPWQAKCCSQPTLFCRDRNDISYSEPSKQIIPNSRSALFWLLPAKGDCMSLVQSSGKRRQSKANNGAFHLLLCRHDSKVIQRWSGTRCNTDLSYDTRNSHVAAKARHRLTHVSCSICL